MRGGASQSVKMQAVLSRAGLREDDMHKVLLFVPVLLSVAAVSALAQTSGERVTAAAAQRDRVRDCNDQAKTQGLKGAERKTFMASCVGGTSSTPTTAAPPAPHPSTRGATPAAGASSRGSGASASGAGGGAVFPTAVSAKYSSESAGKARMHTCLDQYKANQASNANGGLTWIAKGGGYYSECNKRLKG